VPPPPPPAPPPDSVDPFKELVIVDSTVVLDMRASNAVDGPWSFRWLVEQMSPPGTRPGDLVEKWLHGFRQASVNNFPLQDRLRVEELLDPNSPRAWPRAPDGSLDLAQAPFRLLAIVNRPDIDTSESGEARFVFGLIDRGTGGPDLMTVAFEYRLPRLGTGNDRREWATRWHALRPLPLGEEYNAALEAVTRAFASSGVSPLGVNGSALAQLRTNEARFASRWELREWLLDRGPGGAFLRLSTTTRTPDQSLNNSAQLAGFIRDNAAAVLAGKHELPPAMLGGASPEIGAWTFKLQPPIDESLRHAFAMETCNGCHGSETFALQGFFHVGPLQPIVRGGNGQDRLSRFLSVSELPKRTSKLQVLLGIAADEESPPPARKPRYRIVQIALGESSVPVAIDSRGNVLGNSPSGPWIHDGSLRFLFPGETRSFVATAFNSNGDVAGYEQRAGSGPRAFLLLGGAVVDPGTLGGDVSTANAIDPSGRAAGDYTVAGNPTHSFLFDRGVLRDIGTLGGNETFSFAINSRGQIAGQSQRADGARHAFLFDGRAMRDLGSLGGAFSRGLAINDKGEVAGVSELVPGDTKIHAFFHDGAAMTDLGTLPGFPWSSATALNGAGHVVGNVFNKSDYDGTVSDMYAFVHRDGVMWNVNELIPPSSFVLRSAIGINEAGQILCTDAQTGQTPTHAYVLSPQ
jgi:probable HAF family extracellular repeat protein